MTPTPSTTNVDLEFALRAAPARVSLLEGHPTDVWRFSSSPLRGSNQALVETASGYLGPTLRLKRGQRVRIHFDNEIGEDSIVHWHGLYVSEANDGHPSHAVGSGKRYTYEFDVVNRAGTYWYHTHPADRTGPQVYRGLAGLLIVSDDDEARLGLPDGDRELTLVLQDRTFDGDNRLVYAPNRMIGFLGDRMLVNGQIAQPLEVGRGPYRLRIVNGSNSRIYDLAWSDGSPLTVLGTDGGLLDAPRQRPHVLLAPGQRLDVWASFGNHLSNDVWLESREFSGLGPAMGMMGRGMMRGPTARVPNGAPLRIQRFVTTRQGTLGAPPNRLVSAPGPNLSRVVNAGNPRAFSTSMRMMRWFLNGRSFQMRDVAANERVRLGTVEEWEFSNPGGHMAMAHPIHLHGSQFRIIDRQHGPGLRTLREGLFDEGWQDTFLLLPGDRVRLRVEFDRYPGLFLYHCHNLEHEDMGMMRNYLVETS
jgi:FtsP/CotA-like multicopper oxidase with cupredoxin domain